MSIDRFQKDLFKSQIETALQRVDPGDARATLPTLRIDQAVTTTPSSLDIAKLDLDVTRTQRIETAEGTIWVDGNTLLCSCPDCNAPMSIRIWLGLADCWACATSIELTAEQLRAAHQLMADNEQRPRNAASAGHQSKTATIQPPPQRRTIATANAEPPRRQANAQQPTSIPTARAIRRGISTLPAWFISFVIHLILLLLLAIILLDKKQETIAITISTFISKDDKEGGDPRYEELDNPIDDDATPLINQNLGPEELRELMKDAKKDAEELQKDDQPPPLPPVEDVKKNLTTNKGDALTLALRDPRLRSDIVKKEGGTTLTEAAVSRGLRWLASVQNADGSWSIERYSQSGNVDNKGDSAATSLALLPFLGAGQTHEFGPYKKTVARGIKWLIDHQEPDGDLRAVESADRRIRSLMQEQWGMYAHGQATIVLVEALALTGDEKLRDPAQRAVSFIQNAQHFDRRGNASGGWRYKPGQPGDTSVFGWQLMALHTARNPELGLNVQPATMKLAGLYLDSVSQTPKRRDFRRIPDGSLYRYQPTSDYPTPSMTAEGILCRMYLGWKRDDPRIMSGVRWLDENHFPKIEGNQKINLYYWYYGTQVMHHYGGEHWDRWNKQMRDVLVLLQQRKGEYAGSWSPTYFQWGSSGGRIYVTSLAICNLEVYYRHIPLFRQIDLE